MVNSTKKTTKKLAFVVALLMLLLVGLNCSSVFAGSIYDDNVGFSFTIKAYKRNGQEGDSRLRETRYSRDAWKVKMTYSNEPGGKTVSKYWLERSDNTNVTAGVEKTEDAGFSYRGTYTTAGPKVRVWLTGENNNYNGNAYTVKGYWDEETGVDCNTKDPIRY